MINFYLQCLKTTVNELYLACTDIWRKIVFEHVGVALNWRIPEFDFSFTYMHAFSDVLD